MGCKKCQKRVSDSDRIVCRGYCGASYHMICVEADVSLLDAMGHYPRNLFWMCDDCAKLFTNGHFRQVVKDHDQSSSEIAEAMKSMQSDIAKLSSTVTALSEKVETQPPGTPTWPGKRPRDTSEDPPAKVTIPAASRGTKTMATVPVITNSTEPDDLWYIWQSSFPSSVTEDDIRSMVKECLSVDNDDPIAVKTLVKKGVDVSTLSSITFKVGVSRDYRDSSLDPDNWPAGLAFLEFVDIDKRLAPAMSPSGFSKRRQV